jgi:hypothetical protein
MLTLVYHRLDDLDRQISSSHFITMTMKAYFVNMVMHMGPFDDRNNARRLLALDSLRSIAELCTFLVKAAFDLLGVVVFEGLVFDRDDVVMMLLWESLRVSDRLDLGVMMGLVDLFFDGSGRFFVSLRNYGLIFHGWNHFAMDGGIMGSRLGSDDV